jgi:hypothetical protein
MAHIYFTSSGDAYSLPDGDTSPTPISLPDPGTSAPVSPARRPVLFKYRSRFYNVGQYETVIVADESETEFRVAGLHAPTNIPVLADGGDTGGSTGLMIAYQTFARYLTIGGVLTKICESNPGPQSNTLDAAGTGRTTSNLDTTSSDLHATHVNLYISVDGEIPALAASVSIGLFSGTISENVLTAALGETIPVRIGIDGAVDASITARGIPPYTYYAAVFKETTFYGGDPDHPERIYPSRLYEPEAVDTTPKTAYGRTEYPWINTTDGQPVTGLCAVGDELIVGKPRGVDVITTSGGVHSIRPLSAHYGVISHFSMKICGPLSALWFASQDGVTFYFAGTFRYVMGPLRSWWRDTYKANPAVFEGCYAAVNAYWGVYKLQFTSDVGTDSLPLGTLYLLGDFEAAESGRPVWMMDFRSRLDYCHFELKVATANQRKALYVGSEDGYVREEDVMTNADDDGDTYGKKMTIITSHRFPEGQGGDDQHGNTFNGLDLYLVHHDHAATVSLYAGDDKVAAEAAAAQWSKLLPATAEPSAARQRVKRTSERLTPAGVSGKGATLQVEVTSPIGVEFRGYSLDYIPSGAQDRPFSE